ncbi:MAG: PIN domain-containing protein, partial [Chloroflexi bacterium]|nr:PIN domain-containing protein [Chloroflexota bacterium]
MSIETLRAVDSSVILRYLLKDDPVQSPAARDLIESDTPLGVTGVALAEAAWVLTRQRRGLDRTHVATLLSDLLARNNIVCIGLDKREAQAALLRCAAAVGGADFGDALIAAAARSAGVTEVYTFDAQF